MREAGRKSTKNLSSSIEQLPLLTQNALVKDQGARNSEIVLTWSQNMAPYLLKICDDIYSFETASNFSDPELKRMAFKGFKKVVSGSINPLTNSFSWQSSSIKVYSSLFVAGVSSPSGQAYNMQDPAYPGNTISVTMPFIDICGGKTCQMNLIVF